MTKEEFEKQTGYELKERDDNLYYDGNLDLYWLNIKELPNKLIINGSLNLSDCDIEILPEDLTVKNSLILSGSKIKRLPDNLTVNGDLNLSSSEIEFLPKNMTVYGFLDLYYTKIKSIPEDLIVYGNLIIENNELMTFLPNNLNVGGNLYLDNNLLIKSLPKNLTVNGNLILYKVFFESLPDDLIVKNFIFNIYSDIKYDSKKIDFIFYRNFFGRDIVCYNIKKDMIKLYSNKNIYSLCDFINKFNKEHLNEVDYIKFISECKEARNKYLTNIIKK